MMTTMAQQNVSPEEAPDVAGAPQVVRAVEGEAQFPERIFSVVLDRAEPAFDVVAAAVDPETGLAIPRPGEAHPADAAILAGEPMIYAVGVQVKDGPMVASYSQFFNVRVRYAQPRVAVPHEAGQP